MNDRWIYEIQPYVRQANKMQVGTLIGIGQNLVSSQYIKKDNTMIGIVIVGINLM